MSRKSRIESTRWQKTAFNLNTLGDEAAQKIAVDLKFPVDTFDKGLCLGMGRTAMLRYVEEPYLQQHFNEFWDALAVTEQEDIGHPHFLYNLDTPTLTQEGKWDGSRLGTQIVNNTETDIDPVLNMIVRMQMWDQADWDGMGYGETKVEERSRRSTGLSIGAADKQNGDRVNRISGDFAAAGLTSLLPALPSPAPPPDS